MSDNVNHPKHYTVNGMETIDIIKNSSTKEEYEGFLINNVKKYSCRYKYKNKIEDLKKARFYLDRLVKEYESNYLE